MDKTKVAIFYLSLTVVLLAAVDLILLASSVTTTDKVEVMHDQLIIAESKMEAYKASYEGLLERVGGANIPVPPKKPTGSN